GNDVLWIRQAAPGSPDLAVLARALAEDRLLITFDKDFGELVFRRGAKASRGIVLFRISQPSPAAVAERVATVLTSRGDWSGHFKANIGKLSQIKLKNSAQWPRQRNRKNPRTLHETQ